MRTLIKSIGTFVPSKVVTNEEIEEALGVPSDWIYKRSGINQRYWVEDKSIGVTDLARESTLIALEKAEWEPNDIDLIIFSTETPDIYLPGCGCLLQYKLGLETVPTIDIRQQCTGFIYGLSMADAYIKSGLYKKILVVCAEVHSSRLVLNEKGKNTSILFGDGASSTCVEASKENEGILSFELHTEGKYNKNFFRETQASPIIMNGEQIFRHAVKRTAEVSGDVINKAKLRKSDIDLVIPHQANIRINEFFRKRAGFSLERVYNNIDRYGNTGSASIPIALSEAFDLYPLAKTFLFVAYGGGETWGAIVYSSRRNYDNR